jgi:hypothetical protein
MPVTNFTVIVCTAALRANTNNMWRGLSNSQGIPYDASPVDSLPGTHSVPLAPTLNDVSPWLTTPTHWMAASWEFPDYPTLIASLKAGNIPTRDWLPFNLNQNAARTAGQNLYSKTTVQDEREPYVLVADTIAAALSELGLVKIPSRPLGS